jgi:hypothetical protein
MATRAIVTSQPVVACDVCGRRLLRGETPDLFLAGGQRRTVCELCVPRATAEGWLRESDEREPTVRPPRARRGGSLLGRLRQLREGEQSPVRRRELVEDGGLYESEDPLYDYLDGASVESPDAAPAVHIGTVRATDVPSAVSADADGRAAAPADATPPGRGEPAIARAVEVFNAGATIRRVAGVARSLGAPTIVVGPSVDSPSRVAILVAWELCWYRYEIDLEGEPAGAQLVAEGMELDELVPGELIANAVADEHGRIVLAQA